LSKSLYENRQKDELLTKPFKKQEVEQYERKRYRGLDQRLVHSREEKILRKILEKIGKEGALALDVPCGYGRFSPLLLERGLSLVSSDLSFHMVKRAVERNEGSIRHSGVVADGISGLPFKGKAFDFILSVRFFHHLHQEEERKAVLGEFSRVAKEGIILSFYQLNPLHVLQRKLRRRIKKSKTKIKMLSREEFQREVEEEGFKIVRVYPLFKGIHSQHIALLQKN
jgi:SAM-dependent methyltransferase